jgi:hypothetical protein
MENAWLGEAWATNGERPTLNVRRGEKGGEGSSGRLFEDSAIFPDNDRQAEFAGGAFVSTKRQAGELGEFTFLLVPQWLGTWGNHFSAWTACKTVWLTWFAKA